MLEDEDLGGDADARAGERVTPTDAARALALCAQGAFSRPGLPVILVHFFMREKKWEKLSEKLILQIIIQSIGTCQCCGFVTFWYGSDYF
jgi:hypothetical protein